MTADSMAHLAEFQPHMLNEGVLVSPQGHLYASIAMTDDDIDFTIEAAYRSFNKIVDEK
ncbi:MAG: hypothetical protein JRH15_19845 [Deltaproteobacteria bacterium]|nr:hypothetical protein [Deltaproteobacteria bacterium]